MAPPNKLTPLQESEARRLAAQAARTSKTPRVFTDEQKAQRKDRVTKAKAALKESAGLKGTHVAPARAAIKAYLQRLNEPDQPDDARFELLIEAPTKAPPKKRTNDRF
jgi:hypothetical protein